MYQENGRPTPQFKNLIGYTINFIELLYNIIINIL